MLKNIKWLGHSTIKFVNDKVIYIDPYNIKKNYNDADIVFITHNHYDHFSKEDLKKCIKNETKIIVTEDLIEECLNLGFKKENIYSVIPNSKYEIDNIVFSTIPSYNINKKFHPRENNWVGYIIKINNIQYYIAGDTDITKDAEEVKCDVAFLPVGGTYTMNYKEAAELANKISPKIVVPIHYGLIVGTKKDAERFKNNIDKDIKCEIM